VTSMTRCIIQPWRERKPTGKPAYAS
jgi:hypothetical protein